MEVRMFGGALNENAFRTMLCQQSVTGQGIETRWAMRVLSCSKATAIKVLDGYTEKGLLTKTETSWRSNAKKFYYYPTDETWAHYRKGLFKPGYLSYLRAMMEM